MEVPGDLTQRLYVFDYIIVLYLFENNEIGLFLKGKTRVLGKISCFDQNIEEKHE